MSVFELRDVKYVYQSQYQKVEAIRGISCAFDAGMLYAIMGTSGSGKTTLLSLMAGMDEPTEGSILCGGISTSEMDLERYRREKVAVIYQDFRLLPLLTVAENVMYPMELRGMRPGEARSRAAPPDESFFPGSADLIFSIRLCRRSRISSRSPRSLAPTP